MLPNETITLDKPVTLVLSPQTLTVLLDALAEKPFRIANGPFNEILAQLRGSPTNSAGNAVGVPGKGDNSADNVDGGDSNSPG